jgi:hypothetical protein
MTGVPDLDVVKVTWAASNQPCVLPMGRIRWAVTIHVSRTGLPFEEF